MKSFTPMEPSSACSYVATQRGGVALLFEGHRYNKVRDGKDGTVYWRCSRDRQCPGRAVTVNNRVKKSNNKHNHPPEASLLMRNGGGHHSNASSVGHHHHSASTNSTSSAMAAAAAAAAAYASFLQGSNSTNHTSANSSSGNNNNTKSSHQHNSSLTINNCQARPQPHNSPSTASSSSPSPLGLSAGMSPVPGQHPFSSAFSFLHNLTANAASSPNAQHLLNNSLLNYHPGSTDAGRQALNLSSQTSNHNLDSNSSRLQFNHLNSMGMFNHRAQLDSQAKLASNSPPPTPTSNHSATNSLLFSKSLQNQYNNMLKTQFDLGGKNSNSPSNGNSKKNSNNNHTLDLSPRSFSFGHSASATARFQHQHNHNIKSEPPTSPTPPVANTLAQHHANLASENAATLSGNMAAFMLQDAFQEAQAAAVAAAAFPSLLNETFKYLAAAATTNPQMAAMLAGALSNPNMLKNFDLTMATAAAVAAANANNNSNGDSGSNKSLHGGTDDLVDHSPFAALRDLSGGSNLCNDLENSLLNHDEQPLNMALKDNGGNILKLLRTLMRAGGIPSRYSSEPICEPFHALIVPTADAHGSEYIAPCDARRAFLTNFTGSAGTAVVTGKEGALWTDGRYFLQAEQQLDKQSWILMRQNQPETPTIGEWLNKVLMSGSRIGADPYTMSFEGWAKLEHELSQNGNLLVQTPVNLVDEIWTRRPARPAEPVVPLDLRFAGKTWKDKLAEIREEMNKKNATTLVLNALDDIAWLFNLRGADIEFNPVFFAYAIVTTERLYLFIDESKLTTESLSHLQVSDPLGDGMSSNSARSTPSSVTGNGPPFSPQSLTTTDQQNQQNKSEPNNEIELRPYDLIADFIRVHLNKNPNGKIWVSNKSSYALVSLIPETRRIITSVSPVTCRKAIKNEVEINGMRQAHIKDAVALCEFFAWLEDEVVHNRGKTKQSHSQSTGGGSNVTTTNSMAMSPSSSTSSSSSSGMSASSNVIDELRVDTKLEEFRRQQDDYVGASFGTIAGSGPNGAIIHYSSSEETNRPITTDEMFLLDSGAQFRDGTTDVTRTIHLGTPTAYERECFTRVMKGHISLALARFPRLVKGQFLDAFARRSLWEAGLDYNHGTGHGVGMFLNVHEGPIGIANRINNDDPGITENMILSNEPGYYESGKFGIRIESLVVTKKVDLKYNFNDRGYLGFETITLVPIQTKLLDPTLLTAEEIEWIDQYHQQCRDVVGKMLEKQGRTRGLQWLLKETEPIG